MRSASGALPLYVQKRHVKVERGCLSLSSWLASLGARHGPFLGGGGPGGGRERPAAAALHRGGDAEAALPATGPPNDGALLGEMHGQTWPKAGQQGRDLLCELCGALH